MYILKYILSIALRPALSVFVPLSAANREYTGWLKDKVIKPVRKLSLVSFAPNESAQPDQIADLIKELYIPFFFFQRHFSSSFIILCKLRS